VLLANTYIAADEPGKAVTLLESQLASAKSNPHEQRINVALAVALHKNGNREESQAIFDSLYRSMPDEPAPLITQARLLIEDRLWSRVGGKVADWCESHQNDIRTPILIAEALAANEESQAKATAEDILRRILNRDPNSFAAMSALAMLLQRTGRHAESAELYQKVLNLDPENVIAINNLAWILSEEQGRYQQALQLAARGRRIAPDFIDLIDTCGVIHFRLGQYDKAIQELNRSLELCPANSPAAVCSYLHLGQVLAEAGQKARAIENLKKALELNSKVKGLSPAEVAEGQRLVRELMEGP
jgi:tetratricopeptide (TPR) repeat protein